MKTLNDFYTGGEYLKNNPTWDSEDAPWKAEQLFVLLDKNINKLEIKNIQSVSEVGCGSGQVLINFAKLIEENTPNPSFKKRGKETSAPEQEFSNIKYTGYDLSPDAIKIAKASPVKDFEFKVMSIPDESSDLLLCVDVFEHIEDEFTFLRDIRETSEYFLFNIPLDLSVQSMMREGVILAQRKRVGHVNYYTKNLALETLKDTGYEIVAYDYGSWYKHLPAHGLVTRVTNIVRDILMPICPELCVQYLGGSSLVVLTTKK